MIEIKDKEVVAISKQLWNRKPINEIVEIIKTRPYIEWQEYDKDHFAAQGIIDKHTLNQEYNKLYELLDLFDCTYCSYNPDDDFSLSDVVNKYEKIYMQERIEIDKAIDMKQTKCEHKLYRPYGDNFMVCENCGKLKHN